MPIQLSPTQKREKFRELLNRDEILVMPGGFSPLYAKMAQEIGFEAFFVAGSQTSAFLYGLPDNGIIALRDMVDHVRHLAARTDIPIFVDSDTAYGNAVSAFYAVQEFVRSGVAGIQIEDQEAPKKSGVVAGRRCIPLDEAIGKYKAAVAARNEIDPSFVICARCDFIGAEGGSFEGAVERCIAYAAEGGVDMIWLNDPRSLEEVEQAARRIPVPLLIIWGGPQPAPPFEEYEERGVSVALYPTTFATVGMQAAWDVMSDFKARGTVALNEWGERVREGKYGSAKQMELVGNNRVRELEELYIPADQQRDYSSTFGHSGVA